METGVEGRRYFQMTSRSLMLADICSNLRKSEPFEHLYDHLQPSALGPVPRLSAVSPEDLADRFSAELAGVGGEVRRVEGFEKAIETIKTIVGEIGANRVAISDPEWIERYRTE